MPAKFLFYFYFEILLLKAILDSSCKNAAPTIIYILIVSVSSYISKLKTIGDGN